MEDKGVYKCCQRKTEQQKQYGKLGRHIKAQYHKDCQRPVQHQDSMCLENVGDVHKKCVKQSFFYRITKPALNGEYIGQDTGVHQG